MISRRVVSVILVGLLIIGLFALAPVPVASAALTQYRVSSYYYRGAAGYYDQVGFTLIGNDVMVGVSGSVTVDGVNMPYNSGSGSANWFYRLDDVLQCALPSVHTFVWGFQVGGFNMYGSTTITVTVAGNNGNFYWPGPTSSTWSNATNPPLSVSIAGPFAVSSVTGGTWTGVGAGGTGPYTYKWNYGYQGELFFEWPYSGSTFTRVLPIGSWSIECVVTDSLGATAVDDVVVVSSLIVGAYTVDLTRYGMYGQYMDAIVHKADGTFIGISGVSGTQLGIYADLNPPAERSYGYYDNVGVYEGSVNGAPDVEDTSHWKWVMALTVGGATSPPPKDFWFKCSVTLTDDTVVSVIHHFADYDEAFSSWYPAEGGPSVAPEEPPAVASNLPLWVRALLDALYVLLSPIILVFEVAKMLVSWTVGLLGYVGGVLLIVGSFGLLMVRWLVVVVGSVLNFGTAAPGAYVSIQGLMTLAGAGAIAGDVSVFKTVGFGVTGLDAVLAVIHAWIMASAHAWIWWAVFTYAFMALVLQSGGDAGGED